ALAYLVLLRMEVAAFHPSACYGRGLVSVALFVTSPCQGVTLHPALRSPDFPLRLRTAAAWPTPCTILPEVPAILVEPGLAASRMPAGIAEHRNRAEVARARAGAERAEPCVQLRVGIRPRRRHDRLARDARPRLERLL